MLGPGPPSLPVNGEVEKTPVDLEPPLAPEVGELEAASIVVGRIEDAGGVPAELLKLSPAGYDEDESEAAMEDSVGSVPYGVGLSGFEEVAPNEGNHPGAVLETPPLGEGPLDVGANVGTCAYVNLLESYLQKWEHYLQLTTLTQKRQMTPSSRTHRRALTK